MASEDLNYVKTFSATVPPKSPQEFVKDIAFLLIDKPLAYLTSLERSDIVVKTKVVVHNFKKEDARLHYSVRVVSASQKSLIDRPLVTHVPGNGMECIYCEEPIMLDWAESCPHCGMDGV